MALHAPLAEKTAPRVAVGHAHDPEEREADRVAQLLVAPGKRGCSACASGAPCPACAAGTAKLQRSALAPGPASAPTKMLRGTGTPLPVATQAKFERRLGADLSAVRLHRGAEAAAATRAVGARAFALGRDIAFGAQAPSPGSAAGDALLAHEVAHTMQAGAATTLRRSTDFDVIGINPDAASDPSTIFFDFNSSRVDPSELPKVAPLAVPPTQDLTLIGYSSEEGGAPTNTTLINNRIAQVSRELRLAGHTAAKTPQPEPTASEGQVDYRRYRAVTVMPTPPIGGPPLAPPLGGGAAPCTPAMACGTSFANALPLAMVQLVAAIAHVTGNTAQAQAQLPTLFPGVPAADVLTGLNGLMTELGRMPANHRCHSTCDAACDRPAYADPVGRLMTLCPDFVNGTSVVENAAILLHEGLHMVPGLTTDDLAYRHSRLIDFISGAEARINTDSYVILILRLSGSAAGGPPVDPVGTLPATDQPAAQRSFAFLEQWLLTSEWDSMLLYEAIKKNKGRVGGWDTAEDYEAGAMHAISGTFGLTDPGASSPFLATPLDQDQWIVAGLVDRYKRFAATVWGTPITMTQSAAGPEAWAAGLGNSVVVTPAFFALAPPDQVLRLLELMAGSLPTADVPTARRRDYAIGAQQLWLHSGRTGP